MEMRLEQVVDFLEDKILKLLASHENLEENLAKAQEASQQKQLQNDNMTEELEVLKKKYITLKNANALLGSDEHKIETKHKINALIREIDLCIAQLS